MLKSYKRLHLERKNFCELHFTVGWEFPTPANLAGVGDTCPTILLACVRWVLRPTGLCCRVAAPGNSGQVRRPDRTLTGSPPVAWVWLLMAVPLSYSTTLRVGYNFNRAHHIIVTHVILTNSSKMSGQQKAKPCPLRWKM